MIEDRSAKLYAGQMGIVAVLVNVLIDKGVISQDELIPANQWTDSCCRGGIP